MVLAAEAWNSTALPIVALADRIVSPRAAVRIEKV